MAYVWIGTPEKVAWARRRRKNLTPAEAQLWQALRRGQVDGMKFHRQTPMCGWIVDFYCPGRSLVVEVDGPYHEQRKEQDARRDAELARRGVRTVRVSNDEVFYDLAAVIERIRQAGQGRPRMYRMHGSPYERLDKSANSVRH